MRVRARTSVRVNLSVESRARAAADAAAKIVFNEAFAEILDTMGSKVWSWPRGESPRNIVDTGLLRASGSVTINSTLAHYRFVLNYAEAVHYGAWIYLFGDRTKERVFLPPRPFVTAVLGIERYPGITPYDLQAQFRENFRTAWRTQR